MMRSFLVILFVFYSALSFSQIKVTAEVKDAQTKEPLGFCNVSIDGTNQGTITNSDGFFSLSVPEKDTYLIFSYLGYETRKIPAGSLSKNELVLMESKGFELNEVVVNSDNDYIYDIILKCRKQILSNKENTESKVYFGLETDSKLLSVEQSLTNDDAKKTISSDGMQIEEPVELLECFYNARISGQTVDELYFKNGRTALAANDNYFLSLSSSKLFTKIVLTENTSYFPDNPLQFRKTTMRKKFNLVMEIFGDEFYKINFDPINDEGNCFAGTIWVGKGTYDLLKIELQIQNAEKHPFLPLFKSDSLFDVSLAISNTYKSIDGKLVPDHMVFDYHFIYKSTRDSTVVFGIKNWKNVTRKISTRAVLHFYDFGEPFILPYFDYDNGFGDYRKLSFIPYNKVFWNNNSTLLLSNKQKENFGLLAASGKLVNYGEGNYGRDFLELPNFTDESVFDFFYPFWSSEKRLVLDQYSPQFETYSLNKINNSIPSDLYELNVQILLDITQTNDSLTCHSYSVFDHPETYFHLPKDDFTPAFFNIYFDICEMERIKMQNVLDSKNLSLPEIDSIYKATIENMNQKTKKYFKEVNLGKNIAAFQRWNKYVLDGLGIDNIKLVEETNKYRRD